MSALFCLVLPDAFQKGLSANFLSGGSLGYKQLLNLQLGRNTGMVGAFGIEAVSDKAVEQGIRRPLVTYQEATGLGALSFGEIEPKHLEAPQR